MTGDGRSLILFEANHQLCRVGFYAALQEYGQRFVGGFIVYVRCVRLPTTFSRY